MLNVTRILAICVVVLAFVAILKARRFVLETTAARAYQAMVASSATALVAGATVGALANPAKGVALAFTGALPPPL
jgi:hypothetical protein